MTTIYISLGSNINAQANIAQATAVLGTQLQNNLQSPVYRSPAVGMNGPDFLNSVVAGSTGKTIPEVVNWLYKTEQQFGRTRDEKNKFTDRTLDLDLLLYGNTVLQPTDTSSTTLPHSDIDDQAYVLKPLADIAGSLLHPLHQCSINTLLLQLQQRSPQKLAALTLAS